jgi:hypothetical protein
MILLKFSGLESFITFILFIMFGIPFILATIGLFLQKKKPKLGKIFLIASGIYLVIGLGYCGMLMT